MNEERLEAIVGRFPAARVAVVGDFFLDTYLDVDPRLQERSVETGKPAHQVVRVRHSPGAAGTVAGNLVALGAGSIHAVGVVGDDGEGVTLRRDLDALGVDTTHLLVAPGRFTPTYLKPCDAGGGLEGEHERYDTKNRAPTPADLADRLIAAACAVLPQVDALIVSDQVEKAECGVVTTRVREALSDLAAGNEGTLFWVDSRRRIGTYRHMIVKPNRAEALEAVADDADAADGADEEAAARRLRERTGRPVVVTLGAGGALVCDETCTRVPGVRLDGPVDVTGAGDSATAGAVLALVAGATLPEAVLVGNLAASVTVQALGTTGTASPADLRDRLALWWEQQGEPRT